MTVVYLYGIVVMLRPRLIFYLFFLKKKKTKNAHRLRRPSARFITRAGYNIYMYTCVYIGSLECKRILRGRLPTVTATTIIIILPNSNNNNNNTVHKRN